MESRKEKSYVESGEKVWDGDVSQKGAGQLVVEACAR